MTKTTNLYIQSTAGGVLTIPVAQLPMWEAKGWVRITRATYRAARKQLKGAEHAKTITGRMGLP